MFKGEKSRIRLISEEEGGMGEERRQIKGNK